MEAREKAFPVQFKGFQSVSLLDYPGKIAAIVFTGGCNFRCPFCHNRDLVLNRELKSIEEDEILNYLMEKKAWLDGLVVSGGEPTVQAGLPRFLEKVKNLGYFVKIDTNGSNPGMLEELIERKLVDYIAMDVKAPLRSDAYLKAIGIEDERVLKNVERSIDLLLNSNGIDYEFRTTFVPKILREEDILPIAERIKGAKKYFIQQFRPADSLIDPSFAEVKPLPLDRLEKLRDEIAGYFKICKVRGARK
jgi:pyruvate formate lyase activating enzyme